jgi:hypothetical protein
LVDAWPRGVATIVHGWAHRIIRALSTRSRERRRASSATYVPSSSGLAVLRAAFGGRCSILVLLWNRVDEDVVARRSSAIAVYLATGRACRHVRTGVVESNTHVDPSRGADTGNLSVSPAIDLIDCPSARMPGTSRRCVELTGVLVHHLDMNDAGWQFLPTPWCARVNAAQWLDVMMFRMRMLPASFPADEHEASNAAACARRE